MLIWTCLWIYLVPGQLCTWLSLANLSQIFPGFKTEYGDSWEYQGMLESPHAHRS